MSNDYARKVSEALIEQLQRGVAPWQKPWKPGERNLPYNPTTSNDYRGINSMYLTSQGYDDPRWMTYKQAAAAGAQIRKGEKGTVVEYWKLDGQEPVRDANGNPVLDDKGKIKQQRVEYSRPRVFHAVVFNAQQIDGMPEQTPRELAPEPERHVLAAAILRNSGAQIQHTNGDRAFYHPKRDEITLPLREQFPNHTDYYATALHELGHWTGHESRLNRDLSNPFGSEGYAKEELRAEIASLMMGDRVGLGHDPSRHAAYVGSWIKALKEDPREIFRAAADAEKISAYVIGLQQVQYKEQERKGSLQELVDLRSQASQATRDSLDAIADANRDDVMTDDEVREVKTLAAAWRDEAQARLVNAVDTAAPDVKGEWEQLNALEERARHASAALGSAAFTLELARLDPQEQGDEALTSARQAHDAYVQAYGAIDEFIADRDLKMPPNYGAANVYTNDGVRVALQAAHEKAVPSYSPLESWQNIERVAAEQGATASIGIRVGESADAPYHVQFIDQATGNLLPITTDIHRDGKALVQVKGERYSTLWSEDHETQQLDLEASFGQGRRQQQVQQLASNVVAIYDEVREGRAGSAHANPALHFEHLMHQYVTTAPNDARVAAEVLLLDSQRIAAEQGLPVDAVSYLGATLRSYANAEESAEWRALSDAARREATAGALEGRDSEPGADAPQHFATLATHRAAYPIGPVRGAPVLMDLPEASMQNTTNRVYLAVPFREKDEAKAAAKAAGFALAWDKAAKAWSAPADADLAAVSKWRLDAAAIARGPADDTPEQQFANALSAAGFMLPDVPEMDGTMHRARVDGDIGKEQSGVYVGHLDGLLPAGFIQNHRTGYTSNWKSDARTDGVDAALRAQLNAEAEERRLARESNRAAQHEKGAGIASAVFSSAAQASAEHPYCEAKGITTPEAIGALREVSDSITGAHVAANFREAKAFREANPGVAVFINGDLLAPAQDFDGRLWSLQSINTTHKSFMSGGRKAGLHTMVGTDKPFAESGLVENQHPLVLAEGFATGDTVSRAFGHPIIVAFDSGNLVQVAKDLRERFPDREILIAGDNDHTKEGQLGTDGKPKINVGREKAHEAAAAVGGFVLLPQFAKGDKGTDWNDLEHMPGVGIDGVRIRLQAGLAKERENKQEQKQSIAQKREALSPADDPRKKKTRGIGR